MKGNDMDKNHDEEDAGEKIRVSFVLDSAVSDRSLAVPSEPIAIPSDLRRKGLSAVINHFLGRTAEGDSDQDESDSVQQEDEQKVPIPFDFIIAGKLVRTGVETAARRFGLSLEQAIRITYFPAQDAPEETGEGDPLPDWISTISCNGPFVCTGGYDGSISVHDPINLSTVASTTAHTGPIKCLSTMLEEDVALWIATGSLDQSLVMHRMELGNHKIQLHAEYTDGHTASIGSVGMFSSTQRMASGDWDGGLCLWDLSTTESAHVSEEPKKKVKNDSKKASKASQLLIVKPLIALKAHSSQISGLSWGNSSQATGKTLVTCSWDHSVKVWDMERQDCLLTLNGSRVVACMDSSYHSEVVATGHPDCTIRLWDVRTNNTGDASSSLVSDSTLKPSHKEWVSAVQWSRKDPFVLASTSHDGTIKIWDIRSPLPLHTVRAHAKEEKGLCLAYGDGVLYAGGTDCVVKKFKC